MNSKFHDPRSDDEVSDRLLDRLERALIAGRVNRRGFLRAAAAAGLSASGLQAWADELDAVRANQAERAASLAKAYDYIVIGTGSAGSALVGRLAASSDANILVIEAGGWDTAPSVMDLASGSPTWEASVIGAMWPCPHPARTTVPSPNTWVS
ncbi:twin-arginine translocation signal domain-containing protein [Roseateles sp. GG27B]